MEGSPRSITWEAPQHHHVEKGNDWFFALAIIATALVIAAILFNNVMFALLIGVAAGVIAISAAKRPDIVPYGISVRGVKVEGVLYPYTSLTAYHIDEEDPRGPQLLLQTNRRIAQLLVMPIPPEHVDDIEDFLKERVDEEELREPLLLKILEIFGF